jgi:hypothetical protein
MAERLEVFDFPKHGRPYKYEWKSWADGQPWKLVHGKDFTVGIETMRTNARSYAVKNGYKVKTAIVDDGTALVIQFAVTDSLKASK